MEQERGVVNLAHQPSLRELGRWLANNKSFAVALFGTTSSWFLLDIAYYCQVSALARV